MSGNIGFRLIVIIIRNKILNRVFRKEIFEFRVKLRGQSLIVGHDQRGHLQLLNHRCNGECFARASRAQ